MGGREKYRGREPLPANWAKSLERLPPLFTRHSVRLAYLFGSAVDAIDADSLDDIRSHLRPADIDLAYLPGSGCRFRPLYADVSQVLGSDRLDLVNLDVASPGLLYEIIRQGRLIYRESVDTENTFESSVLHRYRDETIRLRHLRSARDDARA